MARIRAWARALVGCELPPPATSEQVAEAETELGYALHPLLRRLYLEVANGGFGPQGWRLRPIERIRAFPAVELDPGEVRPWPDRVVDVMDVGCAMSSVVDCLDPGGQVLLFDPNSFTSDEPEAWRLDAPSLAQWLEGWLDGSCWLANDELDPDDESGWPTPWEDAFVRLLE